MMPPRLVRSGRTEAIPHSTGLSGRGMLTRHHAFDHFTVHREDIHGNCVRAEVPPDLLESAV